MNAHAQPASRPLLAADEPAPLSLVNPQSAAPVLLVCDHASNRFPRSVDALGLDEAARHCHLAIDIGAEDVTRRLADHLHLTAIIAGYSRLVVDLNRPLDSPDAFLAYGDETAIPGNRGLSEADKAQRAEALYKPYHAAVDEQYRRLLASHDSVALVSIHSFTPQMKRQPRRPWEVGVLWEADEPTARLFLEGFNAAGFVTGNNQPYSAHAPAGYTMHHHAEPRHMPHVLIEMRQDIAGTDAGAERFAATLASIIRRMPVMAA